MQLGVALRSVKPLEEELARAQRRIAKLEADVEESHNTATTKQKEWQALVKRLQRKCATVGQRSSELANQVRELQARNVELNGQAAAARSKLESEMQTGAHARDDLAAEVLRAREDAAAAAVDAQRSIEEARAELATTLARERAEFTVQLSAERDTAEAERAVLSDTFLGELRAQRERYDDATAEHGGGASLLHACVGVTRCWAPGVHAQVRRGARTRAGEATGRAVRHSAGPHNASSCRRNVRCQRRCARVTHHGVDSCSGCHVLGCCE